MPTTYNEVSPEAILINNDYTFIKDFIQNIKNILVDLRDRNIIHQTRTNYLHFTNNKIRGYNGHQNVLRYIIEILRVDDVERMLTLQKENKLLAWYKVDVLAEYNLEALKKLFKNKLKKILAEDQQKKRVIHVECEECPVCLDEKNDMFKGLFKCNHIMCKECFDMMPIKLCPLCRSEV